MRTSHDEYQVQLPGWAGRRRRVVVPFHGEPGSVPLAIVPLLDDGPDASACFIVPPRFVGELTIEVLDDPGAPRHSRQVAAFRAALAAGKRAARLERLRRPDDAATTWLRASDLHRQAGDPWRAASAQAIADRHYRTTRGRRASGSAPVITDLLGPGP